MDEDPEELKISELPLKSWLAKQGRGAKASFARKIHISHGRLSNWLRRGLPQSQVYKVATEMGISYETYLRQAGTIPPLVKTAKPDFDSAKLMEDFEHLPDGLKEYVVRTAMELRATYESTPKFMRGIFKPPRGLASYRDWEKQIADLMAKHRADIERDKPE